MQLPACIRCPPACPPAAAVAPICLRTEIHRNACLPHLHFRDDALWALDGLASGSDATARDSLAALAEICSSRRGRLALRSGNLAADVLSAAGALAARSPPACCSLPVAVLLHQLRRACSSRALPPFLPNACPPWRPFPNASVPLPVATLTGTLKLARDPVQALGLATLLLCFCQADADAALLGREEVAAAAVQLLKVGESSLLGARCAWLGLVGLPSWHLQLLDGI